MSMSGQNIANGELRRLFKRQVFCNVYPGTGNSSTVAAAFKVLNLSRNLAVSIVTGAITTDNNNIAPTYPANPGTLQITPITNGDGADSDLASTPIFVSPNFSGPPTVPAGWEFSTMIPKCRIDVGLDPSVWGAGQTINWCLDFAIEYIGSWWDPEAIAKMLNKVSIEPLFNQPFVRSGT